MSTKERGAGPVSSELEQRKNAAGSILETAESLANYINLTQYELGLDDLENLHKILRTLRSVLKEELTLFSKEHVKAKLMAIAQLCHSLEDYCSSHNEFSEAKVGDLVEGFRSRVTSSSE